MKKTFGHKFLIGLMFVVALFTLAPSPVHAVSNAGNLTPASGTSRRDSKFTVSVDGSVAQSFIGAGSAKGTITFPADLLKVTAIDDSGATFSASSTVTPNNSSGEITFSQNTQWYNRVNNQTVHFFTITFQSLKAGTANVNFSSLVYDNISSAATTGGTYTITNPPPPPPPPTPTPPTPKPPTRPSRPVVHTPTPTPSSTPTPEETPDPVSDSDGGLKIENVKISATRDENEITWTLNNTAATPTLLYGTNKSSLRGEGRVEKQDDGSYIVQLDDLKLGTLYYFTIKASTDDNLLGATYSGVLTTRGYPVQLTIEQNNLLIPGAKVKIGDRSFVANKNAIVTAELNSGDITAQITPPGESDAHNVQFTVKKLPIPENGNPTLQSFTLNVATIGSSSGPSSSLIPLIAGGVVIGVAIIGGGVGLLLYRKRQLEAGNPTGVDNNLLTESYGENVTQSREHTPAPNLDTIPGAMPPAAQQEVFNEPPLPDSNIAAPPVTPEVPTMTMDTSVPPVDPASLPLPPTDNTVMDTPQAQPAEQTYSADTQQQQQQLEAPVVPAENTDAEEYSQAVTQVEASDQTPDDEPSAVYDETTGELDIIHHDSSSHSIPHAPLTTEPQQT